MSKDNVTEMTTEMTQDEILMNEDQLLAGLLDAAAYKDDMKRSKKVQIKRDGKVLFEFRVHPLSEEDNNDIRKKCTRYAPDPRGARYGRVEVDVDFVRMRSRKIYEATVEEDQRKLWDNRQVQQKLDCMLPEEVVEKVLMAGEKDAIVDLIDKLSGYGESLEDYAKN